MTQLEYDNIFEAITGDPIEAADLTLRSDLVNTLVAIFKERGWKNADIGAALDIPQSRVSELVRGKIAVLSVQKLFGYLAVLGYRFKPSLDGNHHVVCRVEEKQKEAA
ncbi:MULTISPECIES: helix-turn-helix domain-containing protein [Rhizobium]|nr:MULTISPECIES: XRE family transcriptional regulator [Rhizobium]MBY5325136.1 XRE family transcriptional regulator [Rhizobium leguminosarum]MBY5385960.1 XRE family transcriptional regulator [Rhizobium leguminosarum]NEH46455.1 XRE family transcriptional regulator [Rhizobium leguminosarum]NEH74597.1 XRE family transcriptional regulator [Rhizobium leguminosarum]NEI01398.1 XRE family transcriptional regulator [Rhizobium leguminosarum]